MMRHKSITLRLTLLFTSVSAIALCALGVLTAVSFETYFAERDTVRMGRRLDLVRHVLSEMNVASDFDSLPRRLAGALYGQYGEFSVVGPDGRTFFATSGADFAQQLTGPHPAELNTGRRKTMSWERGDYVYRGIVETMRSAAPDAGPFTVAVTLEITHQRVFMTAFRKTLGMSIAVGILLNGLLGWFVARRGLAPVRNIAHVAKGISATRLGERLPDESVPAELVDLATSFNDMLGRLDDSFQRLSNFSSDLAHELRTPVSNLMTQTQVALSRPRSAEEYREILYSNLEECDRLARMIADMLFLAKADNGLIVPNREVIDLAMEVDELIGFYEALADEQGVSMSRIGNGSISGDRLMIRRAINNLLSNAIRHTPRAGAIKVEIRDLGNDGIRIAVENSGKAIPPEHLPRLFDRFYRVDSCRRRGGEGAGLGLALTKSIVETHGGTISVSAQDKTVRFEMSMGITRQH